MKIINTTCVKDYSTSICEVDPSSYGSNFISNNTLEVSGSNTRICFALGIFTFFILYSTIFVFSVRYLIFKKFSD